MKRDLWCTQRAFKSIMADAKLAALQRKLDAITASFEGALSDALSLQDDDDPQSAAECADLLREALGLVQRSSAKVVRRGGGAAAARPQALPGVAPAVAVPTLLALPTVGKQVIATQETFLETLDPEEKEARELEALRAQFAAGAAEEDEHLDWSAMDGDGAGSDDEGEPSGSGGGDLDDSAARQLLQSLALSAPPSSEATARIESWESREGFVPQGTAGFNDFAREQMRLAGVPANPCVRPPEQLAPPEWVAHDEKPRLQPYQETAAYLCRPQSLPNPRMLVVHRTGSGKTATMIQIADNYFLDRRPKVTDVADATDVMVDTTSSTGAPICASSAAQVLIFPTNAVCNSFYRELSNPHFPNRYHDYLQRGGFHDSKKALELTGILRNGTVAREFLDHPDLPSAPLRAFSYTMAGVSSAGSARVGASWGVLGRGGGNWWELVPCACVRCAEVTPTAYLLDQAFRDFPSSASSLRPRVPPRVARGRTQSSNVPSATWAPSRNGCRVWADTTISSAMATHSQTRSFSWTR